MVVAGWYERHRSWSPPRPFNAQEAVAIFVNDALPGTIWCAQVDGKIVGTGLLSPDPFGVRDDGAHLTFCCVAEAGRADENSIVEALMASCLSSARVQGRSVQFEVSDQDQAAMRVSGSLPPNDLYEGLIVLVSR